MPWQRSAWRVSAVILLAYQALIAGLVTAFGLWILLSPHNCVQNCGPTGVIGLLAFFVWIAPGFFGLILTTGLLVMATRWRSRFAGIPLLVVEGILVYQLFPLVAIARSFGIPTIGTYLLVSGVGSAAVLMLLGVLELTVPTWTAGQRRPVIVGGLVAAAFVIAGMAFVGNALPSL